MNSELQSSARSSKTGQSADVAAPIMLRFIVPCICVVLMVMVWIVYGQTLHHQFVSYDDSVYVYENPVVKKGITFKGFFWALGFAEIGHWHPVTWLSHML